MNKHCVKQTNIFCTNKYSFLFLKNWLFKKLQKKICKVATVFHQSSLNIHVSQILEFNLFTAEKFVIYIFFMTIYQWKFKNSQFSFVVILIFLSVMNYVKIKLTRFNPHFGSINSQSLELKFWKCCVTG